MKLYCVRHGEAHSAEVDPQRGLTEQGRQDVERVAQYLGQCGVQVEHIMHSGKLRAQQTADVLAASLSSTQVTESESLLGEESDVAALVTMIKNWTEDTMLVGHLPFMPKLVSALVIEDENYYPIVNYPPGSIVCLDYYHDQRWIINWLIRPAIVPDLS